VTFLSIVGWIIGITVILNIAGALAYAGRKRQ
jgi:hypothetical protein